MDTKTKAIVTGAARGIGSAIVENFLNIAKLVSILINLLHSV